MVGSIIIVIVAVIIIVAVSINTIIIIILAVITIIITVKLPIYASSPSRDSKDMQVLQRITSQEALVHEKGVPLLAFNTRGRTCIEIIYKTTTSS